MSIETTYYFGEIIAVVVIALSLLAILHQTRPQARASKAQLFEEMIQDWSGIFRILRKDPEFARSIRIFIKNYPIFRKTKNSLRIHLFQIASRM